MNRIKHYTLVILILPLLVGHIALSRNLAALRLDLPAEYDHAEALMVSPLLLEIISGEFKGLVADYLVIKSAIYLGGIKKTSGEDFQTATLLFKQSIQLCPHFFTPMYYTQGVLFWDTGIIDKALDIITVSHQSRFWDWEPGFYLGYDYYQYLGDTAKAATILGETAQRPGAPLVVGSLAAKFSQKNSKTEASIQILQIMKDRSTEEWVKNELTKRIDTYKKIMVIEAAIEFFHVQTGSYPHELHDLVTSGILKALPQNPYADIFYYNPENGKVSFQSL